MWTPLPHTHTSAPAMKETQLSDPHLESTLSPGRFKDSGVKDEDSGSAARCLDGPLILFVSRFHTYLSCGVLLNAVVIGVWRPAVRGSIWNQFDSSKQKRKRRGRRGVNCRPFLSVFSASRPGPSPTNLIIVW